MKKLTPLFLMFLALGCGEKEAVRDGKPVSSWREALQDRDAGTRREAARVLGEIGTKAKSSVPELTRALKDPDAKVRREAAQALWSMSDGAKDALWELVNALHDPDRDVRLNAAGGAGGHWSRRQICRAGAEPESQRCAPAGPRRSGSVAGKARKGSPRSNKRAGGGASR